jgi:hypothetical protein
LLLCLTSTQEYGYSSTAVKTFQRRYHRGQIGEHSAVQRRRLGHTAAIGHILGQRERAQKAAVADVHVAERAIPPLEKDRHPPAGQRVEGVGYDE